MITEKQIGIKAILKSRCFVLPLLILLVSCSNSDTPATKSTVDSKLESAAPTTKIDSFALRFSNNKVTELHETILCMHEDSKGRFWLGTNGGLYCKISNLLLRFSVEDGLPQNQVLQIQEDKVGNLYISCGGVSISKFDGKAFKACTVVNSKVKAPQAISETLWFTAGSGALFLNNDTLFTLLFKQTEKKNSGAQDYRKLSPFASYSILKDKNMSIWFGTQASGVCNYSAGAFMWLNAQGLAGPAVLALVQDNASNIWIGTNGKGLYRYANKRLLNFTDSMQLGNVEFSKIGASDANSLARINALALDNMGALWIGTVDAGVWCYYNSQLKHIAGVESFNNKGIESIYCDQQGKVWFGTNGAGLYKLHDGSVTKVTM